MRSLKSQGSRINRLRPFARPISESQYINHNQVNVVDDGVSRLVETPVSWRLRCQLHRAEVRWVRGSDGA